MNDRVNFEFLVFCIGKFHFGLGCFPFWLGDLFGFVQEDEGAFFVPDNDVGKIVAVDVFDADLAADAGIVVDEVGDEIGRAVRSADEFEPVENSGCGWIRIAGGTVSPEAFSSDDVLETVAIDID